MKQQKATLSVVTMQYIDAQGKSKVNIRLTIARKTKYYPTGVSVRPDDWDAAKQRVRGGADKNKQNDIIRRLVTSANQSLLDIQHRGEAVSFEKFEQYWLKKSVSPLEAVCEIHIRDLHKTRQGAYRLVVRDMHQLFGENITAGDITLDMIHTYDDYLSETVHNSVNTIACKHQCLNALIETARRIGDFYGQNPYSLFKIREENVLPVFLTEDEIQTVRKWQPPTRRLADIKTLFMFQINTGLRYADLMELKFTDIADGRINLVTAKTGSVVAIPLTAEARAILDERRKSTVGENVFKRISNQKYNDYLKLLADGTGIDKKITTHTARHTFATHSLNLGIPLEIISKLLGHSNLATTQIYATITNPLLNKYMEKWDKD